MIILFSENEKVEIWLDEVAKSANTRRNYSHDLNAYCVFLSKSSDKLISEAKAEIKTGLLLDGRVASSEN